jgi:hypothetical protein
MRGRAVTTTLPITFVILGLAGCAGSDTAILFTTNNLGLNVQATPTPTAEISFSREEGLIAPEFEDGSVVPTAASMKHKVLLFAPIATDSGTVFSGGEAAQILARDPSDTTVRQIATCVGSRPTGWDGKPLPEKGTSRPMFFGTTTSIGFRVTMPAVGAAIQLPNVHLGYRRNEMAAVALMGEPDSAACPANGPRYAIRAPDFLAVSSNATEAPGATDGKPSGSGRFNVSQIFATGRAAHAAAHIPAVGASFRAAVDNTVQAATVGVTGAFAPDKSSACIRAWRKGADGSVAPEKATLIRDFARKDAGADTGNFLDLEMFATNRQTFIKDNNIPCS